MNENFQGNPAIMQLLDQMRRRRMQGTGEMRHQGMGGGMGNRFGGLGGMGGGRMGGRPEEFGPGMRFGGGKPDMGGWGSGFKPSFGPPQEEVPTPEMSPVFGQWDDGGGWGNIGPITSWDGPRQSMGQRDAPMPAPPMEMPQMGQRQAPDIRALLGALGGMKRPKGRGGW